jgi:hypothetical protein
MTARLGPAVRGTIALAIGFAAFFSVTGADSRWLGALGAAILRDGRIPHGVPYASSPSGSWPNVTALSELVFHGLYVAGPRGLLAAQLVAVAVALTVIARDARAARATDGATALVLLVVVIGAFPALAIIRVQLFSIALFPVLLSLLHADSRRQSHALWLAVPLLTLWVNLHGAVLVGLFVLLAYLVLERARRTPLEALGIGAAGVLAIFVNPAFLHTPRYFHGVLENEYAQRGVGLWAPLSPSQPFDDVLALAGVILLVFAVRSRPRLWELAALAALTVFSVHAGRSGVWLLFAAAPSAALGLGNAREATARLTRVALVLGLATAVFGLVHGPNSTGATPKLIKRAIAEAKGSPILGEDVLAEQVALRGGKIVIGNPIDAFTHRAQVGYVDWMTGRPGGSAELALARVVLVKPHSDAEHSVAHDPSFVRVAKDENAVLYVRRSKSTG